MFHRALVRAGANLLYSQGFNPRPKLSLPFPRSVGVQSDEELLCVSLSKTIDEFEPEELKNRISTQLPEGCEIISFDITNGKVSFQPKSSEYVFALNGLAEADTVRSCIEDLCRSVAAENEVIVERRGGGKKPFRRVDVRPYIDSISYDEDTVVVKCNITLSGSVRVDEILTLLKIEPAMLSECVKRRSIQWREN